MQGEISAVCIPLCELSIGFSSSCWTCAPASAQPRPTLHTNLLQEDAANAPVNILLTYSVKQERSPRIESLPPGCTPAKLAGLLQTGLFGSPGQFGLKMLVSPATLWSAMLQHDSVPSACCML